jgi:pseudouridine-5'-phosphate glycosidase
MSIDMDKAARESLRWLILQALYSAQPIGASEQVLFQAIVPSQPMLTTLELRRNLDYLQERELLQITGKNESPWWFGKLTRHGVDVVEYTVPIEPGIARPNKYW